MNNANVDANSIQQMVMIYRFFNDPAPILVSMVMLVVQVDGLIIPTLELHLHGIAAKNNEKNMDMRKINLYFLIKDQSARDQNYQILWLENNCLNKKSNSLNIAQHDANYFLNHFSTVAINGECPFTFESLYQSKDIRKVGEYQFKTDIQLFHDYYNFNKKNFKIQMKNICAWLCPPKKKNEGPYDVHEQTFEMEENFADIQEADKQSNPSARIQNINTNEKPQSNESLTLNSQNEDKAEKMQNLEKKYIENKNKIQQQQKGKSQINVNEEEAQEKKKREFQEQKVDSTKIPEQINQQKIEEEKPKPKYNILPSSIKKKSFNPEDYFFKQQQNQFRVKGVDSLKGQQFNIDFCKKGTYFIFDNTANIYVDDSEDCIIFAAPCQSSLFVRNCNNMIIIAVVGQLRTYNCHNCHFSIFCKSQPVIESSSNIHFSSFECPEYEGLKQQFKKAKFQPWNNNWSQIHNFTKKQGQVHHFLESKNAFKQEIDWKRAYKLANLQMVRQNQQIVPFIQGIFPLEEEPHKMLLIFDKETSQKDEKIYEWIRQKNIHILKSSKMKVGSQKHMTLAILINNRSNEEYDLSYIGNPEKISEKEQIEAKIGKYFIIYKDQR